MPNTSLKPIYKTTALAAIKDLMQQYREDNYIDEDYFANILYKDGTVLSYPDDVEQIKFTNIVNIHYQSADCNGDYYNDDISTQEQADFANWLYQFHPYWIVPQTQLIIEDTDDYYNHYFNRQNNNKPV